jgi:hypothetical protein
MTRLRSGELRRGTQFRPENDGSGYMVKKLNFQNINLHGQKNGRPLSIATLTSEELTHPYPF